MLNIELINMLRQLPLNMEVNIHISRGTKIREIKEVYVGNEKYLPTGRGGKPDVIVIEAD